MAIRARYLSTHKGAISDNGYIVWRCSHQHDHARDATECARQEIARRKAEADPAASPKKGATK